MQEYKENSEIIMTLVCIPHQRVAI